MQAEMRGRTGKGFDARDGVGSEMKRRKDNRQRAVSGRRQRNNYSTAGESTTQRESLCTQSFHTLECVNSCCDPLLHVDEVPPWQRRDFIVTGYRPMLSIFNAFLSIFFLHNESGNIWTHLSGVFYTVYVFWQWIQADPLKSDYLSVFLMVFFFFTMLTVFQYVHPPVQTFVQDLQVVHLTDFVDH